MSLVLGAIADDFTGATDLANNLVRAGMRCVQLIGVPDDALDLGDVDAVVVALKSRSCPVDEAVADSVAALEWLQARGARQCFFKYCSTFDSTDAGNIGPVADALIEQLGGGQTVMVPAFPTNGRSVYQGHLFVGDRLLNDSGMQHHPLNPMTDADLVRVLGRQTPHAVGLAARPTLARGSDATRAHLADLAADGVRHVICDSLDEQDLEVLAEAVVDYPLVTGGSGLGQALPEQYRRRGWLAEVSEPGRLAPAAGGALVLSGSCSRATLGQVAEFLAHHPGMALDPLQLAEGEAHFDAALAFAREQLASGGPVLVYASADPEQVKAAQQSLGVARAGELVEQALGKLARTLVDEGVGRLVVAGGESSGAVVSALGIRQLRIGGQIDPGVPWTQTPLPGREAPLSLALKSGNFGAQDFFTRAFTVLDELTGGRRMSDHKAPSAHLGQESQLREQIATLGKSLFDRGLTMGSSGNISVRLDDGGWLMTPTNACLGRLDPGSISRLDVNGDWQGGDKPTKEHFLHMAMYAERPRSGAIVHLHSTHSVAVSCLPGIDPCDCIPPLTAYYVMRVGKLPLVPYHIPGDPSLGDAVRGLAGQHSAVLLANHGPVVAGKNLEAAVYATEELEETAKLFLMLRGENPRALTPEQVAELEARFPRD